MTRIPRLLLAFSFLVSSTAHAQVVNPLATPNSQASEFYVGREFGKPLIAVNLIGGVNKPGVYHVPIGSDLAQVIAYAGGAHDKADLSDISIRRSDRDTSEIFSVNLVKSLASSSKLPVVQDSDVVRIPVSYTMERTSSWVGLFSGIASVVLSIALINDIRER